MTPSELKHELIRAAQIAESISATLTRAVAAMHEKDQAVLATNVMASLAAIPELESRLARAAREVGRMPLEDALRKSLEVTRANE